MELSPLVEKVLAAKGSGGFPLAQLSVLQIIAPVVLPGTNFTLEVAPEAGAYASIEVFFQLSPSMMPGVVNVERYHSGTAKQAPTITSLVMAEGLALWEVITGIDKMRVIIRNTSNVNQYFESMSAYLVVANPRDLEEIDMLAKVWGVR